MTTSDEPPRSRIRHRKGFSGSKSKGGRRRTSGREGGIGDPSDDTKSENDEETAIKWRAAAGRWLVDMEEAAAAGTPAV
jgi:hypothetical protein